MDDVERHETDAPAPEREHVEASRWEVFFPRNVTKSRHAIFVASFPSIVYFWPMILTFFACALCQYFGWVAQGTLGWIAIGAFGLNVLVIVQDFDQKKFIILVLALVALGLGIWIINMKGFTFLKDFVNALYGFEPTFSTSAYIILGIVLAILFGWGMLRPLFNYWKFEHNEFVHYVQPFGRDMSIPRTESTVSKDIPDMLEFVLTFGGGALVIRREGEERARIEHIPFLGRRMKAIERMLSEQRVTTYEHR